MKYFIPFFILLIVPVLLFAQQGKYVVDTEKSKVNFEINHLGVLKVDGLFSQFEGELEFREQKLANAEMTIAVKSIFTDNDERDGIIITEPYLNADTFPNIEFSAKDNQESTAEKQIEGELTIRGNSRMIKFPYEIEYDANTDAFILTAETMINRKDFDLIFGSMNGLIGNRIRIQLSLVGRK